MQKKWDLYNISYFILKTQMSCIPVIFNEIFQDRKRPRLDDYCGYDQLRNKRLSIECCPYLKPLSNNSTFYENNKNLLYLYNKCDTLVEQNTSESIFKVYLDVQQFKPGELKVYVVDDFLVVEGKHEEYLDEHGYISRQFIRKYKLPEDVDKTAVRSTLSSDGVLTLQAPKLALPGKNVREIPIIQTNVPIMDQSKTGSERNAH